MNETIILAVGNVISGLLSGISPKKRSGNEQLILQISEIEKKLDKELGKTNQSLDRLYRNQMLQLFFEVLKELNIRITIGKPNSDVILDLQSYSLKKDINNVLNNTAQNVLDFETTKTLAEMLDASQNCMEVKAGYPSAGKQIQDQHSLSAQIMQNSRERLQKRLQETKL